MKKPVRRHKYQTWLKWPKSSLNNKIIKEDEKYQKQTEQQKRNKKFDF